jgi:hypothetical protein
MVVAASYYFGVQAAGSYFSHARPHILDIDTDQATGEVAELFVVTINLWQVVLQVAYYRRPDLRFARRGETRLGGIRDFSGVEVPLWPLKTTAVEWPPAYIMGDDVFHGFCARYHPEEGPRSESGQRP